MGHTARARHGICPQGCGSISATLQDGQSHPTPSTAPRGSREGTDPGKPKAEISQQRPWLGSLCCSERTPLLNCTINTSMCKIVQSDRTGQRRKVSWDGKKPITKQYSTLSSPTSVKSLHLSHKVGSLVIRKHKPNTVLGRNLILQLFSGGPLRFPCQQFGTRCAHSLLQSPVAWHSVCTSIMACIT